ncbi:spermidine/putrescine ABC transporter ATP-binding protein [Psychrobacillus lasiicapitis]|uniref:Spermidine/putrescine ABC transporter ATP-binding protein n=1 Tax=Psychrobacillus lasiicapitis TaxID=1636719 RepID=A0A544TI63_9BACI|nr:spermidine/putrescine ABC transporter ATP-binding protein [Psychrobacillus lasiicapitis]
MKLYPALTGSRTPTSRLMKSKKISGRSTARKSPMKCIAD